MGTPLGKRTRTPSPWWQHHNIHIVGETVADNSNREEKAWCRGTCCLVSFLPTFFFFLFFYTQTDVMQVIQRNDESLTLVVRTAENSKTAVDKTSLSVVEEKLSSVIGKTKNLSKIELMSSCFVQCEQEMSLRLYVEGYQHLYDLLLDLGTVFSIVATDAKDKVDILHSLSDQGLEAYMTLESMMLYERQIHETTGAPLVGSRTLLRLHRALKFVMLFMQQVSQLNEQEQAVSDIAYKAYEESLANYHPWFLRHTAKLAVYALPSRHELLTKLYPGCYNVHKSHEQLHQASQTIQRLYSNVDVLFTKHNLHDLP